MKKAIRITFLAASVLLFGGMAANAQGPTRIEANVPFDFVVGNQYFSAGEYVIQILGNRSGSRPVRISWKDGEILYTTFAMDGGDRAASGSTLTFDRTNGLAVLKRITTDNDGFSLPTPDILRSLAL